MLNVGDQVKVIDPGYSADPDRQRLVESYVGKVVKIDRIKIIPEAHRETWGGVEVIYRVILGRYREWFEPEMVEYVP